jgi:hypothetical protein
MTTEMVKTLVQVTALLAEKFESLGAAPCSRNKARAAYENQVNDIIAQFRAPESEVMRKLKLHLMDAWVDHKRITHGKMVKAYLLCTSEIARSSGAGSLSWLLPCPATEMEVAEAFNKAVDQRTRDLKAAYASALEQLSTLKIEVSK